MKKLLTITAIMTISSFMAVQKAEGQAAIAEIIKEGVKKVIKAVDLKVQRLQTKTIWLQNAQKVLENKLSKLKLDQISGWMEKQRSLYKKYYEALWKVKSVIAYYHRIKEITQKQRQILISYHQAWQVLRQDTHFSAKELDYMQKVYAGIMQESLQNMDELALVVNSFKTQMSDAKRLQIINAVGAKVDANYADLAGFNQENELLSLQRARAQKDLTLTLSLLGEGTKTSP